MTRRILPAATLTLLVAAVLFVLRRPLLMSAPACLNADWPHCLGNENGVVFMTLAGIPVAIVLAALLTVARTSAASASRAVGARRVAWRYSLAEVGLIYGTAPMLWMTMSPGPDAGIVPGRVSLVPLVDLIGMGPLGIFVNLLILASVGFFAPIRFAALTSLPRILALGAACAAAIEISQYAFQLDRVSSVDDVLLNATGAALAALLSRRWWNTPALNAAHPDSAPTPVPDSAPAPVPVSGSAPTPVPDSAPAPAPVPVSGSAPTPVPESASTPGG